MLSLSCLHLADHVLLRALTDVVTKDRATTVEMLVLIAEVDRRRLYAGAGSESMYAYCVRHLHMSEDVAYKRIRTARVTRRFPAVLEAVSDGRLNLSTVVRLAPHLKRIPSKAANELLSAAEGMTRAELEVLLAQRFPQADLPTVVQELSPSVAGERLAPGPVHDTRMTASPGNEAAEKPADDGDILAAHHVNVPASAQTLAAPAPAVPAPRVAPLSPGRFGVQLTVSQATHDKLRYAQVLLSHAVPSGDLAEVLDRALDALIVSLEKRKFAATDKPHGARRTSDSRHIPAAIRRTVRERDQGRCTYVTDDGHRCEARKFLEYDHKLPVARGGASTVANLRLRCRAHNQLEAERVFGAGFMEAKRQRGSTSREMN